MRGRLRVSAHTLVQKHTYTQTHTNNERTNLKMELCSWHLFKQASSDPLAIKSPNLLTFITKFKQVNQKFSFRIWPRPRLHITTTRFLPLSVCLYTIYDLLIFVFPLFNHFLFESQFAPLHFHSIHSASFVVVCMHIVFNGVLHI